MKAQDPRNGPPEYSEPDPTPCSVSNATYEGVVGEEDCLPRIICDCGFNADGKTWAEAGAAYDQHLNPKVPTL